MALLTFSPGNTHLQQFFGRCRQKVDSTGEFGEVVEHCILKSHLACPTLKQTDISPEGSAWGMLEQSKLPSLLNKGIEHDRVDEEEYVSIKLGNNLSERGEEGYNIN